MIFEVNITKELISMGLFFFLMMVYAMVYSFYFACECGSWWHTNKERKVSLIVLGVYSSLALIVSIICYKLEWFL